MDWTQPTTQLLGRFQPWHEGHTALFKRALAATGQVVILLRSEDGSQNNPWTQEERMGFIIEALQNEGYTWNKEFTIIFVPNITHITYGRDVGYKIQKAYIFVGDVTVALSIGLAEFIAKMVIYFIHERAWTTIE